MALFIASEAKQGLMPSPLGRRLAAIRLMRGAAHVRSALTIMQATACYSPDCVQDPAKSKEFTANCLLVFRSTGGANNWTVFSDEKPDSPSVPACQRCSRRAAALAGA